MKGTALLKQECTGFRNEQIVGDDGFEGGFDRIGSRLELVAASEFYLDCDPQIWDQKY